MSQGVYISFNRLIVLLYNHLSVCLHVTCLLQASGNDYQIHNRLFISFLPGDVSVPTNVIIGISVGSAVLPMAGLLIIIMVMMCVYTVRKKGSGYIQGGQSLLLALGPGLGVFTKLAISHPGHDCTISH